MSPSDLETEGAWLAIVLALVGGIVDAVSFLTLAHLFTAHMSGNSAALGAYFGQGDWKDGLHRLTPIPFFVIGVGLGAAVIELATRRGIRPSLSVALGLEGLLLAAFRFYGEAYFHAGTFGPRYAWEYDLLVALLAIPMGIQASALQRVGGISVHTTYITGMLTNLAKEGVAYLFWRVDRRRGGNVSAAQGIVPSQPSLFRALLVGGTWLAFIAGAVLGGFAVHRLNLNALIIPLGILAGLILIDLWRPLYVPATRRRAHVRLGSESNRERAE